MVHLGGSGGTYSAIPDDCYWLEALAIANQLTVSHKRKMHNPLIGSATLINVDVQSAAGFIYCMTFRVKYDQARSVAYYARVWDRIGPVAPKVLAFHKIEGSEMLEEGITTTDDNEDICFKPATGLNIFRHCSRAFYILMEEIRSARPNLSYKMARKITRAERRKLSTLDKRRLQGLAAERLEKKEMRCMSEAVEKAKNGEEKVVPQ